MILTPGLFIPPHAPPKSFTDWLRLRYGGQLEIAWHPPSNRYHVVGLHRERRKWQAILILQTESGGFLDCNDEARRMIATQIIPSADSDRQMKEVQDAIRAKQVKAEIAQRDFIADAVRDNRHQLFDIAPPSRSKPGAKVIWSSKKKAV